MKNINETKRMQQLAGLIVENQEIDEAKIQIEDKVGDLYAWAGIKSKYDDKMIERYGENVVRKAEEMAPKVLEYRKKLQAIANEIKTSPEGRALLSMKFNAKRYGGDYGAAEPSVRDLF